MDPNNSSPCNIQHPDDATSINWEYFVPERQMEGVVTQLPRKLSNVIEFDRMALDELLRSKRITLWFRQGAKDILRVSIVRRSGRWIVNLGAIEEQKLRQCVSVCRDHFDQWFRINSSDIKIYQHYRQWKKL